MKKLNRLFRLLSDATRLRIIMILSREELCVCQLMGVLGVSQPLVSRNIALLSDAELLAERRQGKLAFYRVQKDLKGAAKALLELLKRHLNEDPAMQADMQSLEDCRAYQKKVRTCDMKTFLAFMEQQRKKRK